ncbi:MAG: hypothetical protein M5U26_25895 [Planctomycetota bacterium]|nr:hypothetical protein [Planctomycetota bacterium]
MRGGWIALLLALLGGSSLSLLYGGEAQPAVVCNVKVLSDKVEDVSSFEAWQQAVIKPDMSDAQKALAAWETVVKFRHHDTFPDECSALGPSGTLDAIKLFNVYGYCRGTGAQPAFLQLVRQMGYEARAWSVNRWGVPELKYGGAWHMFDPGMICYFRKPDGAVASVEELVAGVKGWLEQHPGMQGDEPKIRKYQADPGFKQGPGILVNCPTYDERGNFALNYFGWFSAMVLYDGSNNTPFLYEEASSQGYRVNIRLRKGERLTRNWSNKGLHVTAGDGKKVECLELQTGSKALYYTPKWGDLANGRVGNGTLEYAVPLGDPEVFGAFLSAENLAQRAANREAEALLHVQDAAKPGEFVLHMPCSYVYLAGKLAYDALVGDGGSIAVAFSDNHGREWRPLGEAKTSGPQELDLTPFVLRRYDYRLKFTLRGKGSGLNKLELTHDIQHSQRALPALGQGENTVRFSAGPQESTLSIEGAGMQFKGKQVTCEEFGALFNGINMEKHAKAGVWIPEGAQCDVTFPIETPGDLARIRFGCNYRAGQEQEYWDLQVSLDGGKTFQSAGRAAGPTRQNAKWVVFSEIPPGTRKALVRFAGVSRGNIVLWRHRIDADYLEPRGGFAPIKVMYTWEEAGQPKEDIHIARMPEETWGITCAQKPVLKSIVLERAD